jgi:hypothetical protein
MIPVATVTATHVTSVLGNSVLSGYGLRQRSLAGSILASHLHVFSFLRRDKHKPQRAVNQAH